MQIRKQTISSLGVVCKGKPAHVPKVSDILAQLLQVDDASEINCVNASLVSLLRVHVKGWLNISGCPTQSVEVMIIDMNWFDGKLFI